MKISLSICALVLIGGLIPAYAQSDGQLTIIGSDNAVPEEMYSFDIEISNMTDDGKHMSNISFEITVPLCENEPNVTSDLDPAAPFVDDRGNDVYFVLTTVRAEETDPPLDDPDILVHVSCFTKSTLSDGEVVTLVVDPNCPDCSALDDAGQELEITGTSKGVTILDNTQPVANPQSVITSKNTPKIVTLMGSDADGDALTFAEGTPPTNGALGAITQTSPNSAEVTYTPDPDFVGSDNFTFTADDGAGAANSQSLPATVSITVVAKGDVDRNGIVNIFDVIRTAKHFLLISPLDEAGMVAADLFPAAGQPGANPDTCGDGEINRDDLDVLLDAIVSTIGVDIFLEQQCS